MGGVRDVSMMHSGIMKRWRMLIVTSWKELEAAHSSAAPLWAAWTCRLSRPSRHTHSKPVSIWWMWNLGPSWNQSEQGHHTVERWHDYWWWCIPSVSITRTHRSCWGGYTKLYPLYIWRSGGMIWKQKLVASIRFFQIQRRRVDLGLWCRSQGPSSTKMDYISSSKNGTLQSWASYFIEGGRNYTWACFVEEQAWQ